jgi:hypothetical protein
MIWNIVPVNEYEAQSNTIPSASVIIRREYEKRQQFHFVFFSQRIATKKIS